MTALFTLLSRVAPALLALTGMALMGCTPSPYYVDPDYTEYNRPRTVIVREPAQPPRVVLVREHDRHPPQDRPVPPDEHREHRRSPDDRREQQDRGDVRSSRTDERPRPQGTSDSRQRRSRSREE